MSHSSSDDDFHTNLNFPDINRHKRKASGSNIKLVKAGKKIVSNTSKAVRFPDKRPGLSPRHSYISNSSVTNSSVTVSDDSEDDLQSPHLPTFQFQANVENFAEKDDDSDSSSDSVLNYHEDQMHPNQLEQTDSEDDEGAPPQTFANPFPGEHPSSKEEGDLVSRRSEDSSKSKSTRKNILRRMSLSRNSRDTRGETDITDQMGTTNSNTSENNSRSATIFKDILRKVALTDQQYPEPPSHSDTFIGRVMLEGDGGLGMGGGGMAPGASRNSREKTIDEEEELGFDDNDIQLQRLDFSLLNDEARNLINVHIPHAHQYHDQLDLQERDHMLDVRGESSSDTIKGADDEGKHSRNDGLYAPNPDLYLRGDVRYDDMNEHMMLDEDEDMIAPPPKVQAGVLSSLLQLYQNPDLSKSSASLDSSTIFEQELGTRTPTGVSLSGIKDGIKNSGKKVYGNMPFIKRSTSHLPGNSLNPEGIDNVADGLPSFTNAKPKSHRKTRVNAAEVPSKMTKKLRKAKRNQDRQLHITVHIADILQRQRFIMVMCKALMLFGAPTHRLEEYMVMTSRVLEIDGQFIYFPGCMIIAFGDAATRTSEVHLVKCSQGLNLSKLSEVHKIYKSVIHDLIGVDEASKKLNKILKLKNNYNPWLCVLFYGLGSACVCPWAFSGGWLDIPVTFGVGLCVGYLQFFVSSKSNLYSSVFEVTSSIVVSFIARGIGSINGGDTFCFSAITQGSLALILPGYIILCGSLELQSRNIVAGGVRMFYAIIYSLFLGFGITLGAALYGWVDKNSTSETSCRSEHTIDDKWRILFVPLFTIILGMINQADFRQLPVMVVIAACGYLGNYYASKHFYNVTEFTASIGAFIVGILGNLYSRIGKGLAVSAMLPAIFVQVPSGIASQSTLLAGVQAANRITSNSTSTTSSGSSLSFGVTMVEVSIGISVGLFAAALFIYPFGKKRTGLFSL